MSSTSASPPARLKNAISTLQRVGSWRNAAGGPTWAGVGGTKLPGKIEPSQWSTSPGCCLNQTSNRSQADQCLAQPQPCCRQVSCSGSAPCWWHQRLHPGRAIRLVQEAPDARRSCVAPELLDIYHWKNQIKSHQTKTPQSDLNAPVIIEQQIISLPPKKKHTRMTYTLLPTSKPNPPKFRPVASTAPAVPAGPVGVVHRCHQLTWDLLQGPGERLERSELSVGAERGRAPGRST